MAINTRAAEKKREVNVLVCGASALQRVALRKIIESDPALKVIDIARSGSEAVEKAIRLKPDVITMDVDMPLIDGVTALKDIVELKLAPVIMLASDTPEDIQSAMEAMEAGAFDLITRPGEIDGFAAQSRDILLKIKEAAISNIYHKLDQTEPRKADSVLPHVRTIKAPAVKPSRIQIPRGKLPGFKAVIFGLSTGGPMAAFTVLPKLPAGLDAAIFVVQHMPGAYVKLFTRHLADKSAMQCVEAVNGQPVQPGKIYVVGGDSRFGLLKEKGSEIVIQQSNDPRASLASAIDMVMQSVCGIFGRQTIGVLMTGMGTDGADGMVHIRQAGGSTIAESEETAIAFSMPQEAIMRGGVQRVMPNWAIAPEIIKAVKKENVKRAKCRT
jgi:two-component system chemotaxis response regulator CheB